MKYLTSILLLLFSFSTSAHADTTSAQGSKRITIAIADKTSVLGFGFTPPNESGWSETRSGLSTTLKKTGKSADENEEIEAYLIKLDIPFNPIFSYIEYLKKNIQEAYAKNLEFKLQALDVKEYPQNSQCVRVHLLLEDQRKVSTNNSQPKKWSEQHMLSCGSPKYKRMGFEIRYYQRYYDQNKDDQFSDKADRLFDSLVIEDK